MERDARHTTALEQAEWQVVRVWETDIKHDPHAVALSIASLVRERQLSRAV
jgi:very-short-patch-repair endonuclease